MVGNSICKALNTPRQPTNFELLTEFGPLHRWDAQLGDPPPLRKLDPAHPPARAISGVNMVTCSSENAECRPELPYLAMWAMARGCDIALMSRGFLGAGEAVTD